MAEAYICDAVRTAIGRYGGALATVRPDDLGAVPLRALMTRNPSIDWEAVDDVVFGNANQAGEDNRNIARMSALLAGLPVSVPGVTVNRLCGSGLEALATAARAIKAGDADLIIAGGAESMTRAPFVLGKAETAYARTAQIYDTTLGWRFINPLMRAAYGVDAMPETAENVAREYGISREDQDRFANESQIRAGRALGNGRLAQEIVPVEIKQKKGDPIIFDRDEHPRETSLAALANLRPIVRPDGSVTAGNASGVNDGAAALIVASEAAVRKFGLTPRARVISSAVAGVEPRVMGIGPIPAMEKLLARTGRSIRQIDILELNEAFASQSLAITRAFGLADNSEHVNPNGGAIALGHPLGASGARLAITAVAELAQRSLDVAICSMCIGVGQGIAVMLQRI